ncbi:MAG: UDP-N-acetylmuramoyl-tripeptide--D-alanyl-D-alanine ligase [Corynebacterium sp.]|uniref:UDP-N-acetylmuramoyl-tripeptide--D-alanyl-D- alanine ligase n=1 Tax=unclassified Corynebacterium TaxID=2624378 RepID=UPI0026498560|nr:UDP-N-acetylmuramoyl-tripeptide--D-alanyl-D-alanine ligase [Corynebacterium sp.]MDN5581578.1 UDP-N-acetylmuramoyl-tripeptide--D-alanyl-D-alanine ligase [Corynebacterium sp.]MDN5718896.1 UDP-N-acetylmuramoyl-tripeptide--D-alanyl-D-alanine ligase [Corynebacterium sp.]
MIEMTSGTIAEVTGGQLVDGATAETVVTGPVEFDSRRITPGSVFMALPGQRVDGHDFVPGALRDGAALVMVGRPVGAPSLLCTDESAGEGADSAQRNAAYLDSDPDGVGERVLTAVGRLARYNTDTLVAEEGLTVVGVTGSAGKTSTKDLLGAVLTRGGETVAPPGSFNNEIGHPYTALKAGRDTRFLVAEMSARGQGHIAHLARIAPPRVGVVLNVGTAHLGEFGSREAIARAKGELVESLPSAADGGLAVLNADDDFVSAMRSRTDARIVRFSMHGNEADYSASDITLDEVARASFTMHHPHGEPVQVTLGVFGAHQVSNALAAAAVGMESGLDAATVAGALNSHVAASENRMDVRTRADGVTVINDTYNANPDSMRAGVDALAYTATGRPDAQSWAVLGQMGELGDGAREEHALLGEVLAQRRIGNAVVVGNGVNQNALAESAEAHGVSVRQVENADAAVNFLDLNVGANDVVLVKASYADGLWSVAEGLFVGEEESR